MVMSGAVRIFAIIKSNGPARRAAEWASPLHHISLICAGRVLILKFCRATRTASRSLSQAKTCLHPALASAIASMPEPVPISAPLFGQRFSAHASAGANTLGLSHDGPSRRQARHPFQYCGARTAHVDGRDDRTEKMAALVWAADFAGFVTPNPHPEHVQGQNPHGQTASHQIQGLR